MKKKAYQPGAVSRIAVSAVFVWASSVSPLLAQTAPDAPPPGGGAAPANQIYSMTDLEYLMGPIALYPDPLIALILPASTFPLQIVQADRWLSANPDAVKNNDFSGADAQGWDSSVQALVRFPEIIEMMADHLDWTQSLGAAFSQQPEDVANAVQLLRAQAQKAGNLTSTPQQVVTTRQEGGAPVIFIEPAEPDRIYVPFYDPGVIFTSAVASGLVFGTGFFVGSYWNNRWGWNNRNWNTIWINQPVWRPGRPGGPPPGAWRPDRPGGRPDRPGVRPPGGRPDRPGVRPDRPDGRPDRPGVRPDRPGDRPGGRPDRPGGRPDRPGDRPGGRPDRPGFVPDRPGGPGARPDRPGDRPGVRPDRPGDRPGARPDRPGARPDRPGDRPGARPDRPGDRPGARPDRPGAKPDRPAARPDRPQGRPDRPQARPPQKRPPQARPPQKRPPQARPPQARPRPPQARPRPPQARPPQARPRPPQARPPQARPARPPAARPAARPNRPAAAPNRGNRRGN